MHFDWTVNIGNLVAAVTFLVLATVAWMDLRWRVTNLETWRKEHQIDADSRDSIIARQDKVLERLETLIEMMTAQSGRRYEYTRRSDPPPYHGPERRKS